MPSETGRKRISKHRLIHFHPGVSPRFVLSRGQALLRHPLFWFLTIVGNVSILIGSVTLYWLEKDANPKIESFLDALWWGVATVTTVGYGDVHPVTAVGKICGMAFMIFGTAIFGCFTALFAAVILEPEIVDVEHEMRGLERSMERLEKEKSTT